MLHRCTRWHPLHPKRPPPVINHKPLKCQAPAQLINLIVMTFCRVLRSSLLADVASQFSLCVHLPDMKSHKINWCMVQTRAQTGKFPDPLMPWWVTKVYSINTPSVELYVAKKHNFGIPISNLHLIFDILPSNRRLPVIIFILALFGDIQKQPELIF